MNRPNISCVRPGCDGHAGVLELFEIFERDIVSLFNALQGCIGIGQRCFNSIRYLVRAQLCNVERRNHLRIAPRLFFWRQIQFVCKRAAVTLEHDECRAQNRVLVFK